MQQFTVPQFIDVEDKILGPVSVRQFLILLIGGGVGFIFYTIADFTLFLLLAFVDVVLTGTFAFFRINGVSFHYFLLNILQTLKRPSLRVWHNDVSSAEIRSAMRQPETAKAAETIVTKQPLATAPLSQLALIVDTGGIYKGE